MLYNRISGWNLLKPGVVSCHFKMLMWRSTTPSVNYAKDCLDQLFLIPGLFWSGKGYHLWMWSLWDSQQHFFGHFWHVDSQSIKQTGDPWESLLLTSENTVFCKNWTLMTIIDNVWNSNHDRQSLTVVSLWNHLQCLPIPHEILKRKRTCLYYGDVDPQAYLIFVTDATDMSV